MWVVFAGVGIAIATSANNRYQKRKIAESARWLFKVVDDKAQVRSFELPYMTINEDGVLYSNSPDRDCGYTHLEGQVHKEGLVEFKFKIKDSPGYNCSGKLVAQNKFAGNWQIKGQSFGQFELSMLETVQCHIERKSPHGSSFSDYYHLNFDKIRRRIQGVGIDEAGLYVINGKVRDKKVELKVSYFGKFQIHVKGKYDPLSPYMNVDGTWYNNSGDTGICRIVPMNQIVPRVLPPLQPFVPAPPVYHPPTPQQGCFNPVYTPVHPQQTRYQVPAFTDINIGSNEYPTFPDSHNEQATRKQSSTPFD